MLSIVSIGIGQYPCAKELDDISCAGHDAEGVFDAFRNIMGDDFINHTSICLKDITATEFINILGSLKFSIIEDQDIMVLYFSGHADNIRQYGNDTDFSLLFSDYNEKIMCGYVSLIYDVVPLLDSIRCNIVLILDCCYSGEGLKSATSIVGDHQISVISATSNRNMATYKGENSEFAHAIIDGIKDIKTHNEDFTLRSLQKYIQERYNKSQINTAAGKTGEIYLKKAVNIESRYYNLKEKFLLQLQNGDDKYREALWYAISDIPEPMEVDIFEEYFHCSNVHSVFPVEVNWLVRRAVGSTISLLEDETHRLNLVYELIESELWQEQCVGIIGARYDIKSNKEIYKKIVELVSKKVIKKIDAVWLANLYASDNLEYDYHVFLDTSLMENSWGIQEVYKTASNHGCSFDGFKRELRKKEILCDNWSQTFDNFEKYTNSQLYCQLSKKNERGRLPINSKAKFILSSLYGNWRGYKSVNCKLYFESNLKSDIRRELLFAEYFPQIEYRMAIFDYFITESDLLREYSNELKWGLQDYHPWVRRTAIQAFRAANILLNECNESIIQYIKGNERNIGELDLYIQYNTDISEESLLIEDMQKSGKYTDADIRGVKAKFINRIF